ncbi:hypothetical protein PsorP6_012119 [Peronosclerospora sorghi]|uniref:Uncharacterized protein n=1 Tax=Peronosclerospora sorghi TaxID=230839 RepID=A0ACC0WIF9_9STRA|nr:hypothetical protein PsorP6_012119 [Peronosclerospora sorghi]
MDCDLSQTSIKALELTLERSIGTLNLEIIHKDIGDQRYPILFVIRLGTKVHYGVFRPDRLCDAMASTLSMFRSNHFWIDCTHYLLFLNLDASPLFRSITSLLTILPTFLDDDATDIESQPERVASPQQLTPEHLSKVMEHEGGGGNDLGDVIDLLGSLDSNDATHGPLSRPSHEDGYAHNVGAVNSSEEPSRTAPGLPNSVDPPQLIPIPMGSTASLLWGFFMGHPCRQLLSTGCKRLCRRLALIVLQVSFLPPLSLALEVAWQLVASVA